jgi:predicted outer membrane repeat protein
MGDAPTIRRCRFVGNQSPTSEGGGLYCGTNAAEIEDCYFRENRAFHGGGASCCGWGTTFTRCTFVANTAIEEGGGVRY